MLGTGVARARFPTPPQQFRHSVFGCHPFRWTPLRDNFVLLSPAPNTLMRLPQPTTRRDGKPELGGGGKVVRLHYQSPAGARLLRERYASLAPGGKPWPAIHLGPCVQGARLPRARAEAWYAERAVPFASMHEAVEAGAFASWSTADGQRRRLARTISEAGGGATSACELLAGGG